MNGDAEAFRQLFEAHHAAMFRFAYRLTNSIDAAEDVTQECFLGLMRRSKFDEARGSLRPYLYGIVRNLVRQRERAKHREVEWNEEAAECADPIASEELTAIVQAAICALPPLQREVIALCEFEDLSLEEAAAIVGADIGTVKSRLHRAREGLRRRLAPYRSHIRVPLPKGMNL